MPTPAEQKSKTRDAKSIAINLLVALIIIIFSLISTFFDFETFASKLVMAGLIIAATLLALFLIIKWLKSLDEFEKQINNHACMVALYSSLFYLPLQYISEIGLIPEIHVGIFFMFMWFVYLVTVIKHNFN